MTPDTWRIALVLCLCAAASQASAETRDREMEFGGENFDSIGLAVTLPFGGQRQDEGLFARAEPSLTLGLAQFQPPDRLCEDRCEARTVLMPTYQLSLDAFFDAASSLGSSPLNFDFSLPNFHSAPPR